MTGKRTVEEVAEEVRGWIDDQRYPVVLEWTAENAAAAGGVASAGSSSKSLSASAHFLALK